MIGWKDERQCLFVEFGSVLSGLSLDKVVTLTWKCKTGLRERNKDLENPTLGVAFTGEACFVIGRKTLPTPLLQYNRGMEFATKWSILSDSL